MGVALWPEQLHEALVPDEMFTTTGNLRPHSEYANDPIRWAVEKLGIREETIRWSLNRAFGRHRWDGDMDPIAKLFEAVRDWKDVGVESGTGTGKSFAVAVLILWFLACWEGARAFTFAPKEDQLRLYIWTEIGKLWPRFRAQFPTAELTDLCIRMRGGTDDSWGARGYAVGIKADEEVATKAAGMHAEHMVLVYEETPGIPKSVMAAGENTSVGPHNLRIAIGNPNSQLDTLHQFCQSPGVVALRMSALDHPNVVTGNPSLIPGAVSQASIDRRRMKYGELSPVYQSRVRGISAEQASDSLIRLEWLKAAALRYERRQQAGTLAARVTGKGVDVANSEHGDAAAIVDFADNVMVRCEAFPCPDANALGRKLVLEIQAAGLSAARVGIDTIGVGAGTVNECRRLRQNVQGLNASTKPVGRAEKAPDGGTYEWIADGNVFRHARDQWYWQAREDLRRGLIDMPKDPELWEELTTPTFVDEPRTIIEPKDEIVARLGRSPNKADAFVYANWVRARKATAPAVALPGEKQPHRARPLVVKDGKLQPRPKLPQTIEELVAFATERTQQGRLEHRERLPRRKYG